MTDREFLDKLEGQILEEDKPALPAGHFVRLLDLCGEEPLGKVLLMLFVDADFLRMRIAQARKRLSE